MTKTVLIVEDNELNMKLFNDLLGGPWLCDPEDGASASRPWNSHGRISRT